MVLIFIWVRGLIFFPLKCKATTHNWQLERILDTVKRKKNSLSAVCHLLRDGAFTIKNVLWCMHMSLTLEDRQLYRVQGVIKDPLNLFVDPKCFSHKREKNLSVYCYIQICNTLLNESMIFKKMDIVVICKI